MESVGGVRNIGNVWRWRADACAATGLSFGDCRHHRHRSTLRKKDQLTILSRSVHLQSNRIGMLPWRLQMRTCAWKHFFCGHQLLFKADRASGDSGAMIPPAGAPIRCGLDSAAKRSLDCSANLPYWVDEFMCDTSIT